MDLLPEIVERAGFEVLGLALALALAALMSIGRRSDAASAEAAELGYSLGMKIFSVGATLLWIAAAVASSRSGLEPEERWVPWLFLGFALVTLLLAWEIFRCRHWLTDTGLRHRSPWRAELEIPWGQIRSVRFRPGLGTLAIQDTNGRTRHVSLMMSGLGTLAQHLLALAPQGSIADAATREMLEQWEAGELPDLPV